jgi:hypothetical protein
MKRINILLNKLFVNAVIASIIVYAFPPMPAQAVFTFNEFYVDPLNGSNINAGDGKSVATSTNGAWNSGTLVFTAASGTPYSGATVGDYASVYVDAASSTSYVSRIDSIGGGGASLTLNSTAFGGIVPATAASGISCTIGGTWAGPNSSTISLPFNLVSKDMVDLSGDTPRVNFRNNSTYPRTAGISLSTAGPIRYQGYSNTAGDKGKAIFSTASAIALFNITSGGSNSTLADIGFVTTATTGTNNIFSTSGSETMLIRCSSTGSRNTGFDIVGSNAVVVECETNNYNNANTNGTGFFIRASTAFLDRCVAHDASQATSSGLTISPTISAIIINSIFYNNALYGIKDTSAIGGTYINNDFYNNGNDGLAITSNTQNIYIENCNFISNGGYGIDGTTSNIRNGSIVNCGFYGNTSGTTNNVGLEEINSFNYLTIPYRNPTIGDFTLISIKSLGSGKGDFSTTLSTASLVGYPDVGAVFRKRFPGGALTIGN